MGCAQSSARAGVQTPPTPLFWKPKNSLGPSQKCGAFFIQGRCCGETLHLPRHRNVPDEAAGAPGSRTGATAMRALHPLMYFYGAMFLMEPPTDEALRALSILRRAVYLLFFLVGRDGVSFEYSYQLE